MREKRKRIQSNHRVTIMDVAIEMKITSRQIICRAGRFMMDLMRENKEDKLVVMINQVERWKKKEEVYQVASYPHFHKKTIVQMLVKSKIIQKQNGNKSKSRS